jgi:excinuclease UvrABC ATPase subunit
MSATAAMLESNRKAGPRERKVPCPLLAALVYDEQAYPDHILKQVVDRCRARGLRLAGVVQHRSREAGHRCDMLLEDLATGRQASIFAGKRKEEPSYQGTFTSARKHVLRTFANTQSALMKRRVSQFMIGSECPLCRGKRLQALSVKFAGLDIAEMSRLPLTQLNKLFAPFSERVSQSNRDAPHPEKAIVVQRIVQDMLGRLSVLLDLGLGYLTLERSTPTLSPGELQRLRLATQVRSNLFGVVYVLDEPSAGLHPADTEALLRAFDRL